MAFPGSIYAPPLIAPEYTGPCRDFPHVPDMATLTEAWALDWKVESVWYTTGGMPSHPALSGKLEGRHHVWIEAADGRWEVRCGETFLKGVDLYNVVQAVRDQKQS